ncbi:MAG TPA: cytochrome D1 domain-containing protein [Candidatus Polarisedimenticolaceae bacterium]|nr:cytochrome D1 domain-containing protein [Candidatus Polarisedimenticolaceae bacterium]
MRSLLLVVPLLAAPASPPASHGTLIVLDKAGAAAQLVSLKTGKVEATLPPGVGPHEVAVSPDGKTAVVTNYGEQTPGSSLTVLDLPGRKVARTIELTGYARPHGLTFLPGGKSVAVTVEQQKAVLVVDLEKGAVSDTVETGKDGSHMVVLAPDGKRAYVANVGSGSLSVLDMDAKKAVGHVKTAAGAEGLDVSPDGKEVWVANNKANSISIVDAARLEVRKTLPCPAFPLRVKFLQGGKQVLVSATMSGEMVLLDRAEGREIKRLRLAESASAENPVPIGILVHPAGKLAYVALAQAGRVAVLDLEKVELVGEIAVGGHPDGLGWSPLG